MNSFRSRRLRELILIGAITISPSLARAVSYTAILLHPPGAANSQGFGISAGGQVGQVTAYTTLGPRAVIWNGSAASAIDIHPEPYVNSVASKIAGEYQIGFAQTTIINNISGDHAILWHGSATSYVDLNPTGFDHSAGSDLDATSQVGIAYGSSTFNRFHAALWHGTAASFVDLHPSAFENGSVATSVLGSTQSGYGTNVDSHDHALIWTGTAASYIDLNPHGFTNSHINDLWSTFQVGDGSGTTTGHQPHAMIWSGTSASATDLHPAGLSQSSINAISAAGQAGWGLPSGPNSFVHALAWNGTAASFVDLHTALAALSPTMISSRAYDIRDDGTIVGTATDANSNQYAVLWTPVPEPASCALAASSSHRCSVAVVADCPKLRPRCLGHSYSALE